MVEMDDEDLQQLYSWIDEIPLSRPKKNISRDFSDGVLTAEVVKHFLPRFVDIHNYTPANAKEQKKRNWQTLNRKVFCKLNFNVPDDVLSGVANCNPGVIEFVLNNLRVKIDKYVSNKKKRTMDSPQSKDRLVLNGREEMNYPESSDITFSSHSHPENPYSSSLPGGQDYHLPPHGIPTRLPNGVPRNYSLNAYGTYQEPSQRRGTVPGADAPQPTLINSRGQIFKSRPGLPSLDPRIAEEEKQQQLLEANETIQILQAKIRRLEHLLQLKDLRIEEMSRRLQHQA
eukprot:m.48844 g.48844  ORF g.48844 m.48844 type:complete len:286 (+) comp33928_c0_seq5:204-1061(+)